MMDDMNFKVKELENENMALRQLISAKGQKP